MKMISPSRYRKYNLKILINLLALLFVHATYCNAQNTGVKPLAELINKDDPGWVLVQNWIKEGRNKIEVLPKDAIKAEEALLQLQVTTRSPMGAIVYETGGILIDDGWIRILGSGSKRLDRSITEWNFGKSYFESGEQPGFLLIADDVLGGFFAINSGALSATEIGKIFYFAPDNLAWQSLGIGYSEFIGFCFAGDLNKFYKDLRWKNWQAEIKSINGDQGIHCFPYPWTKEGKDLNKVSRAAVPIQELWDLYFDQ